MEKFDPKDPMQIEILETIYSAYEVSKKNNRVEIYGIDFKLTEPQKIYYEANKSKTNDLLARLGLRVFGGIGSFNIPSSCCTEENFQLLQAELSANMILKKEEEISNTIKLISAELSGKKKFEITFLYNFHVGRVNKEDKFGLYLHYSARNMDTKFMTNLREAFPGYQIDVVSDPGTSIRDSVDGFVSITFTKIGIEL